MTNLEVILWTVAALWGTFCVGSIAVLLLAKMERWSMDSGQQKAAKRHAKDLFRAGRALGMSDDEIIESCHELEKRVR